MLFGGNILIFCTYYFCNFRSHSFGCATCQNQINHIHVQRYRSLTEIENFCDNPRNFKIPIFDKKSSDFCFEKSREILSKPLTMDLNTSTLDKRTYDKKTRDLIGENLLDIEKTLNALNLDFIQAFNELEKTDSAETLFGENFLLENNLKSKGSVKTMTNFNTLTNELDSKTKKNTSTRDYYAPLDRLSTSSDKSMFSPKDPQKTPPTPSSSFSPQEATTLTPRGQFNFNTTAQSRSIFLSPTKRMFTTNQQFSSQQTTRKFDDSTLLHQQKQFQQQQSGHRQRSMSFTENLEYKPNITATMKAGMKLHLQQQRNAEMRKTGSLDEDRVERNYVVPISSQTTLTPKPRSVITYNPKSIRARNLRRLSYNPLNMVITSSSSSGESDIEPSMAHSECDIRSKMYPSRLQRRRQQYLNRKLHNSNSSSYYRTNSHCSNNSSNSNVNGRDKLYGSNASIKSAPHYNCTSARKNQQPDEHLIVNNDDKSSSSDLETDENDLKNSLNDNRRIAAVNVQPSLTPTAQPSQQMNSKPIQNQNSSNLNNIYDFVGKCFNRTYNKQPSMPKFVHGYSQIKGKFSTSNLDLLYADFDVSRLTGKSPTTKSYFDILEDPTTCNKKSQIQRQSSDNKPTTINRSNNGVGAFQWPEKIHGSTVKQNDLIWQLQQQHEQDMKEKEERRNHQQRIMLDNFKRKSAYSSETSSTENDSLNFRQDFMPPSPAP